MSPKRLSIRSVAASYGIPTRVVARAIETGELLAVKTVTETGRERAYISPADAEVWFSAMFTTPTLTATGGQN